VIEATLKSRKYAAAIAEIIHKVPYPVVMIMNSEDHTLLSLSPKRINRADITPSEPSNSKSPNPSSIKMYSNRYVHFSTVTAVIYFWV
jgi:hypothetical protein